MVYLSQIRTDLPPFEKRQEDSHRWLAAEISKQAGFSESEALKIISRVGAKPPQVETRFHYLPEFLEKFVGDRRLFQAQGPAPLNARMHFFREACQGIFSRLFQEVGDFDELLHVSCTGYVAPSPAQEWVVGQGMQRKTRVTHFYHMGCAAAIPALRWGSLAAETGARVQICHTELCTLHLDPRSLRLEEAVVQTLFGDGACAYQLANEPPSSPGFEVESFLEEILPDSLDLMSWNLGSHNFEMHLSKEIPQVLKRSLAGLLERAGISKLEKEEAIWALHPGGPKIIDTLAESLELRENQIRYSRHILRRHGNLSSATLPHIWKEILADPSVKSGTPVISVAFAPGLTACLVRLRVRK